MAIYGVNYSPVFTVMTDKTKGSKQNRANCVKELVANNMKASLTAIAVGTGLGTVIQKPSIITNAESALSRYSTKFANTEAGKKALSLFEKVKSTKVGKQVSTMIGKLAEKATPAKEYLSKCLKTISKEVVKFAKAHPIVAGVATVAAGLIALNQAFNAGKIDQKYTDKAKYENA